MRKSAANLAILTCLITALIICALVAPAFGQTTQTRINALISSGKSGYVLQNMVMDRCAGVAPQNRPYVFDGVGDCYGYCRQVWNAILSDGNVHSEDYYPNTYNKSRWIGLTGGIPVNTAPDPNWIYFSDPDVLITGDLLATAQGHAWGSNWHGGIYAGIDAQGSHSNWDCSRMNNLDGAYQRPLYSGFHYYYKPLHDALAQIPAGSIILDNTDASFTGSWITNTTSSDKYGANYCYISSQASENATATWRPTIPSPAYYNVWVWYPQGPNRSSAAPYTVVYSQGSVITRINQTTGGGGWQKIASSKPFLAGITGYVVLGNGTNESGKVVMADAVLFEYVSPYDGTAPRIHTTACAPSMTTGGYPVQVTIDTTDDTEVTSVTANGIALTKQTTVRWAGSIPSDPALGTHYVTIISKDANGNSATNTNSYYVTAKVAGANIKALASGVAQLSASKYLFRIWGTVNVLDANYFTLSDGSENPVRVYCPTHGMTPNSFASACGIWSTTTIPPTLNCQKELLRKFK